MAPNNNAAVDPDLKPVIHMRTNLMERARGLNMGEAQDMIEWPRGLAKGKNFLVNETFIRVDGVNYVNLRSDVGKFKPIEVNTSEGLTILQTPKCEGYLFAPMPRWLWQNSLPSSPLMSRCMTGQELREAQENHLFLRNVQHYEAPEEPLLWVEYYQDNGNFGDSFAKDRLMAFNRALHRRRVEENQRRHAAGQKYDYENLINSTFDREKHTLKFDEEKHAK